MAKSKNKGRRANTASITTVQLQQTIFLDALPCEIIGMITAQIYLEGDKFSEYVDGKKKPNTALHVFRFASRALNDGSEHEWALRHTTDFVLGLEATDINLTMGILENRGRLAKVKKLNFVRPKTANYLPDESFGNEYVAELYTLLDVFLRKLPQLEAIEVNGHQDLIVASAPAPQVSPLLHALTDVVPPKLQRLRLSGGVHSAASIQSLLEALTPSLRFLNVDKFEVCDNNVNETLALIRDHLELDELLLTEVGFVVDSEKSKLLYHQFNAGQREYKWLRNKLTGKLERYTLGHCWLQAHGKGAIKLALNRVLELESSDLYDPSLTKGSLGF